MTEGRARRRARKAAGPNPSSLPNIELKLRGDDVDLSDDPPAELDRYRYLPLHQLPVTMSKPAAPQNPKPQRNLPPGFGGTNHGPS